MPRECAPDDVQIGGASVVVRGRESRPHGEGAVWVVCLADCYHNGESLIISKCKQTGDWSTEDKERKFDDSYD